MNARVEVRTVTPAAARSVFTEAAAPRIYQPSRGTSRYRQQHRIASCGSAAPRRHSSATGARCGVSETAVGSTFAACGHITPVNTANVADITMPPLRHITPLSHCHYFLRLHYFAIDWLTLPPFSILSFFHLRHCQLLIRRYAITIIAAIDTPLMPLFSLAIDAIIDIFATLLRHFTLFITPLLITPLLRC
jgi:hypothetical protein